MVLQEDATHFKLKHKDNSEYEEFNVELVEEGGKMEFKGLPEVMKKFLLGFEAQEIK